MTEGIPERASLPHLFVPWPGHDHSYRGRGGGGSKHIRAIGDRGAHAGKLKMELTAAQDAALEQQADVPDGVRADGFAIAVEAWSDEPGYALALKSLDADGVRLLSVVPETAQSPERATVWLPYQAVERFFAKIDGFANEQTSTGNPRNQELVANIGELRLAVLRDLWQEPPEEFPDSDEACWWEVWLVRFSSGSDPAAVLRAVAAERGWPMIGELLAFPDNIVAMVRATANELATILSTSATPRELHHARITSEVLGTDHSFQRDLITDLESRIQPASAGSAAVCVLDTGVMNGHPLLAASVDAARSALDDAGAADGGGHGTQMAGLALFGDLESAMCGTELVRLRHRLESVKVIRHDGDTATHPKMYGTVTANAAALVELDRQRRRTFSMAITADGPAGSDGRPTSWSASLDALAFGTDIRRSADGVELLGQPDPRAARLFVVSAGNVGRDEWKIDHLAVSDVSRVQNPSQAWNALTVGAYTERVQPPAGAMWHEWTTLAPAGELIRSAGHP